jgi:hemerythrin-like metal-binding protein
MPLYRAFLDHTVEHFAQEERWMLATGFSADNCHASHHATILETMRAVIEHYEQGDTEIITRLAEALAEWFPGHAATMDAGLAQHLQSVGFDSVTETLADPSRVQSVTMSGCGSVSCS